MALLDTAAFWLPTNRCSKWDTLTDYDHLSSFVSSIRSSRRIRGEEKNWVVEQVMTGSAGIFKKRIHLLLAINEAPQRKIQFQDISKKSFKSYAGSWEILTTGAQTLVQYKLEATPSFYSPEFVSASAFKKNVTKLLEEVREEMKRKREEGSAHGQAAKST